MDGSCVKVVLITAGSAGLGAEVARVFAPDHRVVINYSTNTDRANALIAELIEKNVTPTESSAAKTSRFLALQADVSSKPAVQKLVADTIEAMGRLDIVISNAGWTQMRDFSNLDEGVVEEDWDKCFTMNVKTHLWLAYAAKEELEKSEGCIVTTASVAGLKPGGSSLPYSVTKAAQIHLMKGLAVICAPKIRVNAVSPGLLLTEWGMKFPESKRNAAKEATKLKRLATAEDVSAQVRTLALSRSMTGQNITVDGGSSM